MNKLPQVLLAVSMVQFQNKNIPPICWPVGKKTDW